MNAVRVEVAGESVELLPERVAWWVSRETLIVADVHLGKAEAFRRSGSPIPGRTGEETLDRLDALCARIGPRRLIICGDLLHTSVGLTPELLDDVAERRKRWAEEVVVVPGNHDRSLARVAERWRLTIAADHFTVAPFAFRHDPETVTPTTAAFAWCGHVHPAVRLRGGGDAIKLHCFLLGETFAILPAFNRFTGGVCVERADSSRLFAIADDRIVEV